MVGEYIQLVLSLTIALLIGQHKEFEGQDLHGESATCCYGLAPHRVRFVEAQDCEQISMDDSFDVAMPAMGTYRGFIKRFV